jgi:iron(II)-dependent oxidoreductase
MTQRVPANHLAAIMDDAHRRSIALTAGLDDSQLMGSRLPTVNPLRWEIGHVAWFYENFILRDLYGHAPILPQGDELYDSAAVLQDTRWDLPLPGMDETIRYAATVKNRCLERLGEGLASERDSFMYQFATFHEDMHTEAYIYSRQTLGYPAPRFDGSGAPRAPAGGHPGDASIPGGTFRLGAEREAPFLYDNEKWAHPVALQPFSIAKAPVTGAEFAAFVDAGGYRKREFWSDAGWEWREQAGASHPVHWLCGADGVRLRRFDEVLPLPSDEPVIHVNWFEANAWCAWAGRRLPTEAEWEAAALGEPEGGRLAATKRTYPWGEAPPEPRRANLDGWSLGCMDVGALPDGDSAFGCRQMLGNVWEWTADTFQPFPGFCPDSYREYSESRFHRTKVLRGGAWATRGRMLTGRYRNFFAPERRDIMAGFRTARL